MARHGITIACLMLAAALAAAGCSDDTTTPQDSAPTAGASCLMCHEDHTV